MEVEGIGASGCAHDLARRVPGSRSLPRRTATPCEERTSRRSQAPNRGPERATLRPARRERGELSPLPLAEPTPPSLAAPGQCARRSRLIRTSPGRPHVRSPASPAGTPGPCPPPPPPGCPARTSPWPGPPPRRCPRPRPHLRHRRRWPRCRRRGRRREGPASPWSPRRRSAGCPSSGPPPDRRW